MSLSVVILAAGQGTRMKSDLPKVLHKLCGKEMLWHVISEARKLSDDITVVLYHQAERVRDAMERAFDGLRFVIQDHLNFPGTGGAVMAASPCHEKVLILNGDMPLIEASKLQGFLEIHADIVMGVIRLDNPAGYGRVVMRGDRVERIVEEKDATPEEKAINLVNSGVYLVRRDLLSSLLPRLSNANAQQEYYLTDIVSLAAADGAVVKPHIVPQEIFAGVNSKADLAAAEEIMLERIRKRWMAAGVTMRLPQTIYLDLSVEFEGECEVESHCVLKGKTKIIRSTVKAGSVIEDAILIDSDCGPMARIRPGTLMEGAHVGNFVEIKNATLHRGVKAGHLSYIGDAEVGEESNIGAGTITCNYDGINKHRTIIGKKVFVGSDTQLVAPVTVADGAMIAAGTTITTDVPEGALAISRTPQKNVAGFVKRFFASKGKA
ncbi:MAG: bifunctional UDP-N-acetylglucosamine diphosphorylase/glucosamine-1-phosphate N-acetyltransferase GlmU [Campylobacterales bacterium]